MIQRCQLPPEDPRYPYYRGITVCKRWQDFRNFLADMGERPSKLYTIDRYPDKNGKYKPGNARWATKQEQAVNRRNTHWITFNGQTHTICEWAKLLNVAYSTIRRRLDKGHSIESILMRFDARMTRNAKKKK
jgi:hypothetical protein